jgi:hemerythrin-like domain-containing protein
MSERKAAYKQFSDLLKSHSEAEEKAVYMKVRALPDRELKIKTSEGFSEHWLCSELMEKIGMTRDPITWSGHVNVLAEILEHHLKEEERDLLPMIHDQMDAKLNEKMLREYLQLREKTQKRVTKKNAGVLESQLQ